MSDPKDDHEELGSTLSEHTVLKLRSLKAHLVFYNGEAEQSKESGEES